jgi:hypothetical protein
MPAQPTSFADLFQSPNIVLLGQLLSATIDVLDAHVGTLGSDLSRWHPDSTSWSVNQCLGHLMEADERSYSGRIRQIIRQGHPTFAEWQPERVAMRRADDQRHVWDLMSDLRGMREEGVLVVNRLRAADLDRYGFDPVIGQLTIRGVLAAWVRHDFEHLRQIASIVEAGVAPLTAAATTLRSVDPA